MKKHWPILLIIVSVLILFKSFFLQGFLPIPSDDIVGLYYPFFDHYESVYPRGIPFKNFLITDPVRQQYPWRYLAIELEKRVQLPLWNPYNFSGSPLLANMQSATLYPLNIFFFILPFPIAWSLLIFLQPLLAGLFLYLYLQRIRLSRIASLLGAVSFAFCGFSVSWLEWNTLVQVALWLPLVLLAKEHLLERLSIKWIIILIFAECSAILGGHLQILFYTLCISNIYLFARIFKIAKNNKHNKNLFQAITRKYIPFLLIGVVMSTITAIQWLPTLQLIFQSARDVDQLNSWQRDGWFIPWQHIVQFIAPDFFGNPSTNNYWSTWNYGEFVGYIGILPLIMALYALFFRQDKKTLFFGTIFFISMLFAFPTPLAKLPFVLHIPFLSTSQPTRLLVLIDFSLCILATLGFDLFARQKKKIIFPLIFLAFFYGLVWALVFIMPHASPDIAARVLISRQNLIFPTAVFILITLAIVGLIRWKQYARYFYILLVVITLFDLLRFGGKYDPFVTSHFLYPSTPVLSFLQKNAGNYRIMETDKRIFAPNFSVMYHLQSVDGYDPLYLLRYGEFIAAMERGKPDITQPFGFNRIITPENYNSRLADLLGVKYILLLDNLQSSKLQKVFEEKQTKVYENTSVFPRIFFVQQVKTASTKQEAVNLLFDPSFDLRTHAIVENDKTIPQIYSIGNIRNLQYSENTISFDTQNSGDGFVILTDTYYPTWHATIDGQETTIYRTDYTFRGIEVPRGQHHVVFYDKLF